jgi:hypothetical protein
MPPKFIGSIIAGSKTGGKFILKLNRLMRRTGLPAKKLITKKFTEKY